MSENVCAVHNNLEEQSLRPGVDSSKQHDTYLWRSAGSSSLEGPALGASGLEGPGFEALLAALAPFGTEIINRKKI